MPDLQTGDYASKGIQWRQGYEQGRADAFEATAFKQLDIDLVFALQVVRTELIQIKDDLYNKKYQVYSKADGNPNPFSADYITGEPGWSIRTTIQDIDDVLTGREIGR